MICSIGQTQIKTSHSAFQIGARIEIASFPEGLANRKCCAQSKARKYKTLRSKKGARTEIVSFSEWLANSKRSAQRQARE